MSFGPLFSIDTGKIKDADFSMIGISGNINAYQLLDAKYFLFGNVSIGRPLDVNLRNAKLDNDDSPMIGDFILGIGYYTELSKKIDLMAGLGLHMPLKILNIDDPSSSQWVVGIGIGSNIWLHYKFNRMFYVDFGSLLMFDFFADAGDFVKYMVFGLRPYIGIGINE